MSPKCYNENAGVLIERPQMYIAAMMYTQMLFQTACCTRALGIFPEALFRWLDASDINSKLLNGQPCLHLVALTGSMVDLQILLHHPGLDLGATDRDGSTVFHAVATPYFKTTSSHPQSSTYNDDTR